GDHSVKETSGARDRRAHRGRSEERFLPPTVDEAYQGPSGVIPAEADDYHGPPTVMDARGTGGRRAPADPHAGWGAHGRAAHRDRGDPPAVPVDGRRSPVRPEGVGPPEARTPGHLRAIRRPGSGPDRERRSPSTRRLDCGNLSRRRGHVAARLSLEAPPVVAGGR